MRTPVVFVDLDGVFFKEWRNQHSPHLIPILIPEWVQRLSRICKEGHAQCVVASHKPESYDRNFIQRELVRNGGFTGQFHNDWRTRHYNNIQDYQDRWDEINDWLTRNPTERWVWLDDDERWTLDKDKQKRFIRIRTEGSDGIEFGLTDKHVEQALQILNDQ